MLSDPKQADTDVLSADTDNLKDLQDPQTGKIPPRRVDIEGDMAKGIYNHIAQYITEADYEAARQFVKNPEDYDFFKILNWPSF